MYTVLNVLHVLGAVFVVGPMAILPMTGMRAIRAGAASSVRTIATSTRLFTLISIVVALLGFALVGLADPEYDLSVTTGWVLWSIILYIVALGLTLFLVVPALGSAADALEESGADAGARYPRVAAGSGIVSVLLLAVVVLMVWRP